MAGGSFLSPAATAQTNNNPAFSARDTVQSAKAALERKDYAEALRLLAPAANRGNADAQAMLGRMYENGLGVTQDWAQASDWYGKAALQNNASAEAAMGRLYLQYELSRQYALASTLLHKAAAQGNTEAELWLGLMYYEGKAVPQNYAQAAMWFRRAADKGDAWAETMLGSQYLNGEGVPKDYGRALDLFRKSAAQGNDGGQYALGLMYGSGLGVPQDVDEALKWFRMAAAQGNEKAKRYVTVLEQQKQEAMRSGVPPALQFKCFLEAFDPKIAGAGANTDLIEGIKRSSNDPRYEACIERFNKRYGSQRR